jgi:hypothetical protein
VTAHTHFETLVLGRPAVTPLLAVCPVPGCNRLTMGGTCVQHDEPVDVDFPRGRPFVPGPAAVTQRNLVTPV